VAADKGDTRAELQAFVAMALDLARQDPSRRVGPEVRKWQARLAERMGVVPMAPATNRELLDAGLRLARIQRGYPDPLARRRTTRRPEPLPTPATR
jgi:hypothetical protein